MGHIAQRRPQQISREHGHRFEHLTDSAADKSCKHAA